MLHWEFKEKRANLTQRESKRTRGYKSCFSCKNGGENIDFYDGVILTLLHPGRPKLYAILAFLGAVGLKVFLIVN